MNKDLTRRARCSRAAFKGSLAAAQAFLISSAIAGCGGAATNSPPGSSASAVSETTTTADTGARATITPATTDQRALASTKERAAQNEPFELIPARGRSSRNEPRRPSISPVPLRISSLPAASIPAPLKEAGATRAAFTSATPAAEIVVRVTDRPARSDYMQAVASVPSASFSEIRIGTWVGWGGGPYARDGGAFITCSSRYSAILPARWQTLSIKNDHAELTVTDGWFDQSTCKASVVRRTTVKAAPLFGGQLIYAYRACGATCGEREELTLVLPRAQNIVASAIGGDAARGIGSFTTVSLPIRKGGGGSMMARIPGFEIHSFRKSAGLNAEPGPAKEAKKESPAPIEIFFGVEVTQSIEDPEPFAIAYIGPENAMKLAATFGVGHPEVGLSTRGGVGVECACQPTDPLCSCL